MRTRSGKFYRLGATSVPKHFSIGTFRGRLNRGKFYERQLEILRLNQETFKRSKEWKRGK